MALCTTTKYAMIDAIVAIKNILLYLIDISIWFLLSSRTSFILSGRRGYRRRPEKDGIKSKSVACCKFDCS